MDQPITHRVGDLVMVADIYATPRDRGVVYRVTRVLPVNIVAEPVNGGRPIKGKPSLFVPAPADLDTTAVTTVAFEAPLCYGQIVTVTGPGWTQPPGNLYVVLRESPDSTVRLALLGGQNGRYWPGIPRRMLTVIDPARISLTPPA